MKDALMLTACVLSSGLLAASTVAVPTLPPSEFADTESVTNLAIDVSHGNMGRLDIVLAANATPSNNVQIAFGVDANGNGALEPTANEWCTPTTTIDGWSPCNVDAFPQPGLVVALSGNPMGHCGILDFDGAGISAQGNAVTRRSVALIRGRYRVYERRQDETER